MAWQYPLSRAFMHGSYCGCLIEGIQQLGQTWHRNFIKESISRW
jgi:hypothetical protein